MTLQDELISFQNFLVIAAADGALQEDEKQELIKLGSDMGLQPADLKPIVTAESLDFLLHSTIEDNESDLGDMLTIAAADGIILKAEFDACHRFASMAEISKEKFEAFLQIALSQHENEVILERE